MYQKGYYAGGYSEHSPIMEYHAVRRPDEVVLNGDAYVDRREFERRDVDRRVVDIRDVDRREMDRRGVDTRMLDPRDVVERGLDIDRRYTDRRDLNGREGDRIAKDTRYIEKTEGDRRDIDKRDIDRRDIDRRDIDRRNLDRVEIDRREVDRREGDRKTLDRRVDDRVEIDRRGIERRDDGRRNLERRDDGRRNVEMRTIDRVEIDRRDLDRRDIERRDIDRREIERREIERPVKGMVQVSKKDYNYSPEARERLFSRDLDSIDDRYEVGDERRLVVKRQAVDDRTTGIRTQVDKALDDGFEFLNIRDVEVDPRGKRDIYESKRRYEEEDNVRVPREKIREYVRTDGHPDDEYTKRQDVYQKTRRLEQDDVYYRGREADGKKGRGDLHSEAVAIKDDFRNQVYSLKQKIVGDQESDVHSRDEYLKRQDVYQNTRRLEQDDVYYRGREADVKKGRGDFHSEAVAIKDDFRNQVYSLKQKIVGDQEGMTMPIDREKRVQTMQARDQRYYSDDEYPANARSSTYHYEVSDGSKKHEGREGRYDGKESRYDGKEDRYDGEDGRYEGKEGRSDGREVRYNETRDGRGYEIPKETKGDEEGVRKKEEVVVEKVKEIDDGTLKVENKENYGGKVVSYGSTVEVRDGKKISYEDDTYRQSMKAEAASKLSKQAVSYYKPFRLGSAETAGGKEDLLMASFMGMGIFANENEFTNRGDKFFNSISDGTLEKIGYSEKNLHLTSDCVGFAAPREDSNYLKKFMLPVDPKNAILKSFKNKILIPVIHPLDSIKYTGAHGKDVFYYITKGASSLACWAFRSNEPENIDRIVSEAMNKRAQTISGNKTGNGAPLIRNKVLEVKTSKDIQEKTTENRETVLKQSQVQVPHEKSQKTEKIDYIADRRVAVNKHEPENSHYAGRNENTERSVVKFNRNDAPEMDGHVVTMQYEDSPEVRRSDMVTVKQTREVDRSRQYMPDDAMYSEKVVTYTKPQMQENVYSNRVDVRNNEMMNTRKNKITSIEQAKIIFTDSDDEPTLVESSKQIYSQPAVQQTSNHYTSKTDSPRRARKSEIYSVEQPRMSKIEGGTNGRRMQAFAEERIYRDNNADVRRKQMSVYNEAETLKSNRNTMIEHQYQQRSRNDGVDEGIYNRPQKRENERSSRYQADYRMSHTLEPQHRETEYSMSHNTTGNRSSTEIDCMYLGMIRVNKIRGDDEVDNAVEFLKNNTSPKNWARVNLEITPARICVSDYRMREEVIHKCNLRHLSYAGISSRNNKFGGFIEATEGSMLCHVFLIEPNANRFYRALSNAITKFNQDTMRGRLYSR